MSSADLPPIRMLIEVMSHNGRLTTELDGPEAERMSLFVTDLRNHLIAEGNQSVVAYQSILERVHHLLPDDQRIRDIIPSTDEIRRFFTRGFPGFVWGSGRRGLGNLGVWAEVRSHSADLIYLWGGLFKMFGGTARSDSILSAAQKSHLLLNVIIHELGHVLVFFFFGLESRTPERIGKRVRSQSGNRCFGESGWQSEWSIMGGSIAVEWADGDEWNLAEATRIFFQVPPPDDYWGDEIETALYDITASDFAVRHASQAVVDSIETSSILRLDMSGHSPAPANPLLSRYRGSLQPDTADENPFKLVDISARKGFVYIGTGPSSNVQGHDFKA